MYAFMNYPTYIKIFREVSSLPQRKYQKASLIQSVLRQHYPDRKMDIYDIYNYFPEDSSLRDIHIDAPELSLGTLSDSAFEEWLLDAPCAIINPATFAHRKNDIEEPALFEINRASNMYVYRHLNYYQDIVHSHSYFEMYYIFSGSCSLFFQEKRVDLLAGDFLIIAPGTPHFMVSDGENFILNLSVRRSDFEAVFRAELSRENILALFFNNVLFNKLFQGFLLFHTKDDPDLKYAIKNATMESMIRDEYSFALGNCWLNILLSNLVRIHFLEMEMEPPVYGSRFFHILQYIRQNYRTVTLDILVRQFRYTKPYLCAMFRENTGKTFSQVVNLERTRAAALLLEEGQRSVEDIAFQVGYASTDHFSRTFKKIYGVSPSEYRGQRRL